MIDLHCHVLPGIDDGPATLEDSLALARAAAAAGIATIVATPHVSRHHRNDAATIAARVDEVRTRFAADGLALEVRPGAEIAMTTADEFDPDELRRLSLGGGPWLLVECPFSPLATGVDIFLLGLQSRGHRIVLAHPERSPVFQRDRELLPALVRAGVLASITAGSLVGSFGGTVKRFAHDLVRDGLVHNVASDAHDVVARPPSIRAELERAGFGALTEWLTEAVPAAILTGEEQIPPRPAAAVNPGGRTRSSWLRRRHGSG